MTDPSITLRDADGDDLARVESLLAANGLPSGDVRTKPECFHVARADGALVGVGGVEVHGSNGLLRSVVVPEPHRGQGYGRALCDALEARARDAGVGTLFLLTTTAADFFRRRGYEAVDRDGVPPAIAGTTEFADLCPNAATCMRKRL
ncbi:arsenic resistance N-acetyltransferase ArsN2 [Halostella litorea]|uniref:arsenic resistance N-acetyltransferase ArsN2 n=1 Tax=Halostella litorea TaxID=2528831 RepID=UPI0010930222|nr:arsenic resistance N-acetyltransferase ArsN2 [Halostella litorea]